MFRGSLTDRLLLRETVFPSRLEPLPRVSMSPSTGDVATPESKTSSGFANVFKSLTGGRSTKSPNAPSPASAAHLNGLRSQPPANHGGPPNYELLYEKLKVGNELADRVAAAESLRTAVKDFPLSGVTSIFNQGKDLIDPSNPREARAIGFELLTACVQQSTSTDPERLAYFHILKAPANPEDFHLQVVSLVELAENGRNLAGFHYETLPLLTTWLREGFDVTVAARKGSGRLHKSKEKAPLGEETTFALLFAFVVDVIKFSFNVSSEGTTGELIDVVLHICTNTTVQGDLCASINVINAIVTYGDIPSDKLLDCVKVLCSIHCLVDAVQPEAWRSISNLCISHNGETTVRILLNILREPPQDGTSGKQILREIRGALSVLEKLFAMDGKEGYPLVPFTLLMASLTKVVNIEHTKVQSDVLRLILSLFRGDAYEEVKKNVFEEDWSILFGIVTRCAQGALEASEGSSTSTRSSRKPLAEETTKEPSSTASLAQNLYRLILRIESLLVKFSAVDFFQREECIRFFVSIHEHLPETCAKLVIDYYIEYLCCSPSDLRWKENTKLILEAFFTDRTQPTIIRLHALKAVTQIFDEIEVVDKHEDPETTQIFVTSILNDIPGEKDILVLQEVIAFAVAVSNTRNMELFNEVVGTIRCSIFSDRPSPLSSPTGSKQGFTMSGRPLSAVPSVHTVQTPANINTRGLIEIFMRDMYTSPPKASQIFGVLLEIAKSHHCETDARLSALKMLCRLRADWADRIFLSPYTESDGLAASLYRTPASLARKQAADEAASQARSSRVEDTPSNRISRSTSFGHGQPPTRQPVRTASGVSRTVQRNYQVMWMEPDPVALPQATSGKTSTLLLSALDVSNPASEIESTINGHDTFQADYRATKLQEGEPSHLMDETQAMLDVALYLETVIDLIQNRCEWEVYSYMLVHLSSQLTNHALFKSAIPQIKALRELLCDQIKNNTFQDPPMSSGLRKADVAICFFQILTMLMSYHQHFSRADQDEIVRTFLQGVGERTSKCCIHALSICCHELPGSTSKVLVNILAKMSQIITQSHVAVHILEFLACLARLPNLYVNFREDEYRTVFAICFRYLQYVRDQREKENPRNSNHGGRLSGISVDTTRTLIDSSAESNFQPNTSDDLPQYVYALAYHVIIFWFLCLKITDRHKHVSWIVRNLVTVDINGREKVDEQAEVTLDFMQRTTYADVDESAPDPSFNEDVMGKILKQRWIVGKSLITIEQATQVNLTQITKRQPSGTSSWRVSETYTNQPAHQIQMSTDATKDTGHSDSNLKMPAHMMQQLMPYPNYSPTMRPIPLPDDGYMQRAISSFNRLYTVDGHKVGVVYIGENQTSEVEILSNIQGSSDYTKFLSGLGTLTKLRGANFNTQGLDRSSDIDGEYTYCWRDRVTEIVFHVITQMPTNVDHDPQCINKKRHIGNDFVSIIFNNSGLPFKFDTFPSEFNYVNIVITPESRASFVAKRIRSKIHSDNAFYRIQVMSKPGFPEISPAAETKIVSLSSLPELIRLLALNASVFSLVWYNRAGGEHVSSWRSRLREINRLRERYGGSSNLTFTPISPSGTSNGVTESRSAVNVRDSLNSIRRSSVANFLTNANEPPASQRNSMISTTETEVGPAGGEGSLIDALDFSGWANAGGGDAPPGPR